MPKSNQRPSNSTTSRAGNRHRQNPLLLWRPDGGSIRSAPRSSRLADFLDRDPRLGPPPVRCTRFELAQILDVAMEIASGRRDPRMGEMTTTMRSSSTPSESSADETQSHHSNSSNSADSAGADSSNEAHQEQ